MFGRSAILLYENVTFQNCRLKFSCEWKMWDFFLLKKKSSKVMMFFLADSLVIRTNQIDVMFAI